MKTILFARDIGGLGDLLMTLPAVRRYKEMGWRTIYSWPNKYLDWAKMCPFIDIIIPAYIKDTRQDNELGMAEMEPDAIQWIRNRLMEAHMPHTLADEIDSVVNLSWPEQNIEEACLASGCQPVLNRVEMFWCACYLPLDELPQNPMPGVLECPENEKYSDTEFCVVQAQSADVNRKPFPPKIVWPRIMERMSHGDFINVVVAALNWPQVRLWAADCVGGAVGLNAEALYMLVRNAEVVFAPDSALLHIAAIAETPCEAWFSSTNGEITCRRYPMTKVHQSSCIPCYHSPAMMRAECVDKERCLVWEEDHDT